MGHGVEGAIELDVVVEVHAGVLPLGQLEGIVGERSQRRSVDRVETLAPALSVSAHGPGIEIFEQLGDATVQLAQREESLVADPGQDPAFHHLDGDLDLGLVAGFLRPRGHDRRPVVAAPLVVASLDSRLVAARTRHAALQLIGDHELGHAPEEGQGATVTADEVGHALRLGRFGVRVTRSAEGGDEQLDLAFLARVPIDDLRLVA